MDIDTLESLFTCPLFKGLTQEEIMQLMHTIRYRVIHYQKGDVFAQAKTKCMHADIILNGEMTTSLVNPVGRSIHITVLRKGNMLAPAFLFAQQNLYPVTAVATTYASVFRIMPPEFETLLKSDSRISMNFVRILSNLVANLTQKVGIQSLSVREKVCLFLKQECQLQQSNDLRMNLSRQQLADKFNIQKFSLQRCLNELQEEKIIQLDGKTIHVLDPEKLQFN